MKGAKDIMGNEELKKTYKEIRDSFIQNEVLAQATGPLKLFAKKAGKEVKEAAENLEGSVGDTGSVLGKSLLGLFKNL